MALVEREFGAAQPPQRVVLQARDLQAWESSLLILVAGIDELCKERGIPAETLRITRRTCTADRVGRDGPRKDRRPGRAGAVLVPGTAGDGSNQSKSCCRRIPRVPGQGDPVLRESAPPQGPLSHFHLSEVVQQCGADALGIVTLIRYLVGITLAFRGAVQLQQFGSSLYVADLVGIGIVHEMGAM